MKSLKEECLWFLGRLARLRFWYLAKSGNPLVFYTALGLNSALAIFILGYIAQLTAWPLIFPSLGPTIFLAFYSPHRAISAPKNALLGHLLGGVVGTVFYLVFKQLQLLGEGFDLAHVFCAALTVGITGSLMVFLEVLHPPAASTALLAALGYFDNLVQFAGLMSGLLLLIFQAKLFHYLEGIDYPWWSTREKETMVLKAKGFSLTPHTKEPQDLSELTQRLVSKGKIDKKF